MDLSLPLFNFLACGWGLLLSGEYHLLVGPVVGGGGIQHRGAGELLPLPSGSPIEVVSQGH
jgi:hypothetical protein